ncbi:hypothetical protein JTE90_004254 [Oedothorax gibbosus]|uniref:RING-type domain-containing protein n=1 Tax=Oedothorax gibbosus TaxID=931172 RepID=A0AAV6UGD2_9ARAC|nr:hypothetical protein JTE90_004254 [Oedothorax gibbosus]
MQSPGKTKLVELNELLTCILCKGYFIDATTISECLHSFCRTCIVRYLQDNKFCPSCEVQVHKTKPLQNIRSDQTLQDIVYKLVPDLFKNEMKRRRDFYQQQDDLVLESIPSSSEKRGDVWGCDRLIFTPDDVISVSLEYSPLNEQLPVNFQANAYNLEKEKLTQYPKRYFNCPGALKVFHLKKLLQAKYGLIGSKKKVEVLYMHDLLKDQYTLVDLAYIYSWKRSEPLRLFFKITQEPPLKVSSELPENPLPSLPPCLPPKISSSMAAAPSSRHPSPPPSPQMAQEPNDVANQGANVPSKGSATLQSAKFQDASLLEPKELSGSVPTPIKGEQGSKMIPLGFEISATQGNGHKDKIEKAMVSELSSPKRINEVLAERIVSEANSNIDSRIKSCTIPLRSFEADFPPGCNFTDIATLPQLKSALKKTANFVDADRRFSDSQMLNLDVTKRRKSKKRVSFSVNLVQGEKRKSSDFFDEEATLEFDPVKKSEMIHLRKKVLSNKSS